MSDSSHEVLQVAALLDENLNGTNNTNNTNLGKNGESNKIEQNVESKKRKTRSPSPKKGESKRSKEKSRERSRDRKESDRHKRRSRERSKDRRDRRSRSRDRRSRERSRDRRDRRSRSRDRRSRDRHDRRSRSRDRRSRSRDRRDRRSRSRDRRSRERRSRSRDRRSRERSRERRSKSRERSRSREKSKENSPQIERTQQYKDASTIFVSQLPILASAREVARFFEKVGKVRDVRLIPSEKGSRKSRGFGYVEFDNPEQAMRAINELPKEKFQGRTLFIQSHIERMTTTTQKMNVAIKNTLNNNLEIPTRLFVGNLDNTISENDLRDALKQFGEIVSFEHRDDIEKGKHCLILFKDSNTAEEAYHGINDKPIKGKMLKYGLAKEPPKTGNAPVHRNLTLVNNDKSSFTQKLYNPNALIQKTSSNTVQNLEYDTGLDKIDDDRGGIALNAKSRAILMTKLQRSDDFTSSSKSESVSPCVLLKNVFDPKEEEGTEWPKEIEEDVAQECRKYGNVRHCAVDPKSEGYVYLRFETSDFAKNAIRDLNGRWFGKRQIVAEIFPLSQYTRKFPN